MRNAILLLVLSAAGVFGDVEEKNRREERFTLPAGPRRVIVDGVQGSITVRGRSGNEVSVVVNERWRAENSSAMAQARRDVSLNITQQGNELKLYVDGPFRCGSGCVNFRDHDRDYDVQFDFELDLPKDAAVELKTVNNGRVRVDDVDGDFTVRNVNGRIELNNMGGSGSAHTVNGSVRASFTRVPKSSVSFKSVNGELRAEFPNDLSADITTKNLHGSILTDFESTVLPVKAEPTSGAAQGTKFVYRSKSGARIRVGAGGPEHRFETLNGDIEIAKRGTK